MHVATVERKNSLLTGRNLQQNQAQCERPSATTDWGFERTEVASRKRKERTRLKTEITANNAKLAEHGPKVESLRPSSRVIRAKPRVDWSKGTDSNKEMRPNIRWESEFPMRPIRAPES
ncbi:hypothetical protein XENORESO_013325 [Xenotaenia resolanae]|uniref:Uncharacterized protein n=1 Tax=Xenotaenia resolanae TaxID=208358 RepID=A0ABV0VQM4_9TELE